jgi:transposase-like protein
MHYHRNAKTNVNQRLAMKNSQRSSRGLGDQYEVSHVTTSKWKKRDNPEDESSRPKTIHYAVDPAFWKIVKKVRQKALFTLDDLLIALKPYIENLNRTNCYRILFHYRLNRLSLLEKRKSKQFAFYKPGYLHIDVFYLPRIEKKKYYCFLAIDRATRMVFLELYPHRRKQEAADFLVKCLNFFPYRVHHVLTDNGREFTMKGKQSFGRTSVNGTLFELVCELAEIKYRKTKVKHPWTNGMAERMVRTTKEHTTYLKRYQTMNDAITDIKRFQSIHNFQRKLKVLDYKTPYEVTMEWFVKDPDIFLKNPTIMLTRL